MNIAKKRIGEIKSEHLRLTALAWRGNERQLVIEIVRSLDEAAFAFTMAPNGGDLYRHDVARRLMIIGAASALRPFLEIIKNDSNWVNWGPSSSILQNSADNYLISCGRIAIVERAISFQKYGLATIHFQTNEHLIIEIEPDSVERTEKMTEAWLSIAEREKLAEEDQRLSAMKDRMATLIDRYVNIDDGWFIGYGTDNELVEYHDQYAKIRNVGNVEAHSLPPESLISKRTFKNWNAASLAASGRALHHIAFATRLLSRNQNLQLRNLLTVFARKVDINEIWRETEKSETWVHRIVSGLTLNAEVASRYEKNYETPLPYYIDFGKDFVLLPVFGCLLNPSSYLVEHLKHEYRRDWDKSVAGREKVFQENIRSNLPTDRYHVPIRNFKLKNPDGSMQTDIDAIILDQETGDLGLLQLKWPDIYGMSTKERASRQKNLLKANEWVEKVSNWINNRPSKEIASIFGIGQANNTAPTLVVMSRHTAAFSGEVKYDSRSTWISWPRFVQLAADPSGIGLLNLLKNAKPSIAAEPAAPRTITHDLPGLRVELHVKG